MSRGRDGRCRIALLRGGAAGGSLVVVAGSVAAAAAGALLVACGEPRAEHGSESDGAPSGEAPAPELALDTIATGLETPWGIAFAPDGRILLTERPGRIRVVREGRLDPQPWAEVAVVRPDYRSEGGLLGIAVAPDFGRTGHVFVVGTFRDGAVLVNRVLRYTERDGRGVDPHVVLDALPGPEAEPGSERAIHTHLGGGLLFGPDGMLYVTTGDATHPALSGDTASMAGKVLRIAPNGRVPFDNPFPESAVFALGLRNPQGLAWHPALDVLLATEHGPSELSWETFGGWFGDELNGIRGGAHYGWPHVAGEAGDPRFVDPLREWSPSIAPGGVAVYTGTELPWGNDVLVASLRGQHLRRLRVEAADPAASDAYRVTEEEPLLEGVVGRIRALAMGPDGHLYLASSNTDGRGRPSEGDDRVYRLRRR